MVSVTIRNLSEAPVYSLTVTWQHLKERISVSDPRTLLPGDQVEDRINVQAGINPEEYFAVVFFRDVTDGIWRKGPGMLLEGADQIPVALLFRLVLVLLRTVKFIVDILHSHRRRS